MRRNTLVVILVAIVMLVAYFFLIFNPQTGKINDAREEADAAEAQVQQLELELAHLRQLQKDEPKLREQAAVLDAAMPNDPQLANFILQVQDSANAAGIEWLSVSPSPPAAANPPQPGVLEVTIAMNVEGGYFQVQDFVVRLETLSRALKIGTVSLGVADTVGAGSPLLSAALNMKMFVAQPIPAATAAPSPAA